MSAEEQNHSVPSEATKAAENLAKGFQIQSFKQVLNSNPSDFKGVQLPGQMQEQAEFPRFNFNID